MKKENLKNLTNEELYKLLNEIDWLDKELLQEYDERRHDGRIQIKAEIKIEDLEEHFRKRRKEREKKKAS